MTDEQMPMGSNAITRQRKFSIEHHTDVTQAGIYVCVYKYLSRNCLTEEGKFVQYTEENDPENPFYTLVIDTDFTFREALNTFKLMGVRKDSELRLSYDGNHVSNARKGFLGKIEKTARGEQDLEFESRSEYHSGQSDERVTYHKTPFTFGDLDSAFIRDIEPAKSIFMRADCMASEKEGFAVIYERDSDKKGKLRQRIGCIDNILVQSRLYSLIQAARFEVSQKEKELLELVIEQSLKL